MSGVKLFIFDLHGHGQHFKQQIRNMVYACDLYRDPKIAEHVVHRVYHEIAIQTVNYIDGDPQHFLQQLINIPSLLYFKDFPQLQDSWHEVSTRDKFIEASREFAMKLFTIIFEYFGITDSVEYMLENIAYDHFSVTVFDKRVKDEP